MKFIFAIVLTFSVSGCAFLHREAGYPGGNIGYYADKKVLFARAHDQQVSRYLVSLTLLAPLIAETAETPREAALSAQRINRMMKRLARLDQATQNCKFEAPKTETMAPSAGVCGLTDFSYTPEASAKDEKIPDSAFAFESLSFEVGRSLNDALKQIYDNFNIRKRISDTAALDPSNLLRAVLNIRRILPAAMKYYATYRDVALIVADSVITSCGEENEACKDLKTKRNELFNHHSGSALGNPDVTYAPIREVFLAARQTVGHKNVDWQLQSKHRAALVYHLDRACVVLQNIQEQDGETAETKCHSSTQTSGSQAYLAVHQKKNDDVTTP